MTTEAAAVAAEAAAVFLQVRPMLFVPDKVPDLNGAAEHTWHAAYLHVAA